MEDDQDGRRMNSLIHSTLIKIWVLMRVDADIGYYYTGSLLLSAPERSLLSHDSDEGVLPT